METGKEERCSRLIKAERIFQAERTYTTRLIRDAAIIDAHREGVSASTIAHLVDMSGEDDRRSPSRREVVPEGLLNPADAIRRSGLRPAQFVAAVREGRVTPVDLWGGVRAFRVEDIDHLVPTPR